VLESYIAIAVPNMRKIEKIVYNMLKIKRRYFQVAFCCGRYRMPENRF